MSGDARWPPSGDLSEKEAAKLSTVEATASPIEVRAMSDNKNDDNNKQYNPLNLLKPISVIFFVSCYSPLFLAIGGLGMSILFQNF